MLPAADPQVARPKRTKEKRKTRMGSTMVRRNAWAKLIVEDSIGCASKPCEAK